jgi:hypothetical protein
LPTTALPAQNRVVSSRSSGGKLSISAAVTG